MSASDGSFPSYRIPDGKIGTPSKIHWQGLAAFFIFFLGCNVLVTQRLAEHLHRPLGTPLFHIGHTLFYPPWDWLWWSLRFSLTFANPLTAQERSLFAAAFLQIAVGAIAALVIRIVLSQSHAKKANQGAEDLHGSARFQKTKEIAKSPLANATRGIFVGAFHDTPETIKYLRDDTDENVLVLAPTGSAKTTGMAIPNLLSNEDVSMIVIDPKGELHQKTSGYRSRYQNILRFAPVEENSSQYNLFSEIRLGTPRDVSDAQNIAKMFCHVPGLETSSGDPHWDQISYSLITGVILHVCYKAKVHNHIATGRDIGLALTPLDKKWVTITNAQTGEEEQVQVNRTFEDTLEEMLRFAHDPDGILYNWSIEQSDGTRKPSMTHPVVIEKAMEMVNRINAKTGPNDEYSGALSTAKRRFEIYSDALIQRNTDRSDFSIYDLVDGDRPTTLYLVMPLSDQERLLPLLRVMISIFFNRLTEPERAQRPNRQRLLWLIDEFPALKKMEIIDERLPLARGYGMRFLLIAQSIEQILKFYTDHQSISDNCGLQVAYTPNGSKTKEELSALTGLRTVVQPSSSFTQRVHGVSSESMTTHLNHVRRPLMTPDEVGRLRAPRKQKMTVIEDGKPVEKDMIVEAGDLLLFRTGQYPILGRQLLYFFDPVFLDRSRIPEVTQWSRLQKRIA